MLFTVEVRALEEAAVIFGSPIVNMGTFLVLQPLEQSSSEGPELQKRTRQKTLYARLP